MTVGEIDHQALFKRVGVVVHHGGAGTTHAATRGGAPQVILPQYYASNTGMIAALCLINAV